MIDTHCHLDFEQFDEDREAALERSRQAGVTRWLNVAVDEAQGERALQLAENTPGMYSTAGIHPHYAQQVTDETWPIVESRLAHPQVKAVGEVGLDYYHNRSPQAVQHSVFQRSIELACQHELPLVIHVREAHEDVIDILERAGARQRNAVMHCFSGTVEHMERYVELGCYISFSGTVTFPRAERLRIAAAAVPTERLLAETDSPYLAPQVVRGRRNEPAHVMEVVQQLASLRDETPEAIAQAIDHNATELFGLDQAP